MCARFTLFTPPDLLVERFNLHQVPALVPRYNVAPSQPVAVVGTRAGGGRGLAMFKWGFVPHWSNAPTGPRPVNAKAETVADKPTFRDAFRQRRCLIPADGFYEWRDTPEGKRALFFRLASREVMALAGIWDCWKGESEKLFTCAILTTTANTLLEPIHDRMPVVLPPDSWDRWLDPTATSPETLLPLLRPYPAAEMEAMPVGPAVNSSRHEGRDCLSASGDA